ncbi:MAG: hypothetical protein HUU20_23855, partial [Pirellulales bacterium]|nr:hypothetical protein [Pirellulales bacterium]
MPRQAKFGSFTIFLWVLSIAASSACTAGCRREPLTDSRAEKQPAAALPSPQVVEKPGPSPQA